MSHTEELKPTLVVVATGNQPPGQVPVLASHQLFRSHNTVRIEHQGQCYLLRITRENKLILTK
ncbi:MAG: hemin uptake protein HemP [Betaproteobacteria bacterium]|nr:hemin uptake protein HemP [Betaproteobacteria bacterium]